MKNEPELERVKVIETFLVFMLFSNGTFRGSVSCKDNLCNVTTLVNPVLKCDKGKCESSYVAPEKCGEFGYVFSPSHGTENIKLECIDQLGGPRVMGGGTK